MPHASTLIATIVVGIGLAFILGTIANRLRISPLVGYLLAGVAVGPFTPGYTADQVLLPPIAAAFGQQGGAGAGAIGYGSVAASLGLTFAKVAGFIGLMLLVGRRAI